MLAESRPPTHWRRGLGLAAAAIQLLLFLLLGELLAVGLNLPIPGAVIGMALLFAWTLWRGVTQSMLEFSRGLLRHLALLFLPAAVGVMTYGELLREEWLALLAVMLISTAITMAATGLTLQWLIRRKASHITRRTAR